MKKVIGMIIVVMMVVMVSCAVADDYEYQSELLNKIDGFLRENELDDVYYGTIDACGVYCYAGVLDREICEEHGYTDWDNAYNTFADFYKKALIEECPEYEISNVRMGLAGTYEGVDIYHIVVEGNGDLVENEDGDRHIVSIITAF